MDWKAERLILERRGVDAFLVPHSDFALFFLTFEREDQRVIGASFGSDHYVGEQFQGSSSITATPATWSAFVGHYRSFSPWLSNFRVIERRGSLFLVLPAGAEARLTPLGDAHFRVDKWGDEIRFGWVVDGRAIEATLITSRYYRVDSR